MSSVVLSFIGTPKNVSSEQKFNVFFQKEKLQYVITNCIWNMKDNYFFSCQVSRSIDTGIKLWSDSCNIITVTILANTISCDSVKRWVDSIQFSTATALSLYGI